MKTKMMVYIEPEQRKLLDLLSARTGAPIAELVRRAIGAYLESRKKELR